MTSSRGTSPDYTIEIYQDSEDSDHGIDTVSHAKDLSSPVGYNEDAHDTVNDSRDGSETEVVDEGDEEYYDHSLAANCLDLDLVKSIEHPIFEMGHGNDRNFSSATAIHLHDSFDDPFVDDGDDEREHILEDVYEDEEDADADIEYDEEEYSREEDGEEQEYECEEAEAALGAERRQDSMGAASRQVSDFSTLPDEMDVPLPEALSPPVWSHRSFRRTTGDPASPNRSNRLISSPQNSSGRHFSPSSANAKDSRFVSSPLARQSPSAAAFRNTSSVRAMQLSSPSPPQSPGFARSPRSARQRRLGLDDNTNSSRNGTPSRNHQLRHSSRAISEMEEGSPTPLKHPNPKKEYPLVLLHCSFSSPPLPYSPAVLRAVLPDETQESLTLLREQLRLTVLERGMLIPHPGEDYELLEERILESLELKSPRLGKCGHFVGSDGSRELSAKNQEGDIPVKEAADLTSEEMIDNQKSLADPKCETCSRHVADRHRGCAGDGNKRWDIRVYASNGLMRAGAWGAAWREMEKIDVEISVWLAEETRVALEHDAQAEFEREGQQDHSYPYDMPKDEVEGLGQHSRGEKFGQPRSVQGMANDRSASTAACSRPTSRHHHNRRQMQNERLPLSSLLLNFIKRTLSDRSELLLQILVIGLAVALFKQWQGQAASPMQAAVDIERQSPVAIPQVFSTQHEKADILGTLEQSVSATAPEEDEKYMNIPACTFPAGKEGEAGMTALPIDLARSVLASASLFAHEVKTAEAVPEPTPTLDVAGMAVSVAEMVHALVADDTDSLGE